MPKAVPDLLPNPLHPEGFPKSARLLVARDYDFVFARAKAFRDPLFTLLARENDGGTARLGLIIAKKKIRRSVDRNQVKRIVRTSFRLHRSALPGVDLIFIATPRLANVDNRRLFAGLERQWPKLIRTFS